MNSRHGNKNRKGTVSTVPKMAAKGMYHSAEGWSEGEAETTESLSFVPAKRLPFALGTEGAARRCIRCHSFLQ
jgi:hypothetical protein